MIGGSTIINRHGFFLFLLQPTNAQLYITTESLYIIYTTTCIDISVSLSGSFTFVPC